MNPDETPYDSFYGNLFGVRKSVRYHQRRQAFHEWWNTVIIALSFACSASAMAEWSAEWRQLLIGATSFLLMLNWVVGLTRRANAHAKLGQRFASLEQDMVPFEKNRDLEAENEERFRQAVGDRGRRAGEDARHGHPVPQRALRGSISRSLDLSGCRMASLAWPLHRHWRRRDRRPTVKRSPTRRFRCAGEPVGLRRLKPGANREIRGSLPLCGCCGRRAVASRPRYA